MRDGSIRRKSWLSYKVELPDECLLNTNWSGKFSVFRKMPVKGCKESVLQTNTGGRVEYTKVIERTILKELCNTTGRKLARCPPQCSNVPGRSEYRWATVYQKHRSLLNRKMMYRGWHLPSASNLKLGVTSPQGGWAPGLRSGERQQ